MTTTAKINSQLSLDNTPTAGRVLRGGGEVMGVSGSADKNVCGAPKSLRHFWFHVIYAQAKQLQLICCIIK